MFESTGLLALLVKLLYKLGYIENYASGLNRMFKEYEKEEKKPSVEISSTNTKITLPNKNYEALFSGIANSSEIDSDRPFGFANINFNGTTKVMSERDQRICMMIRKYPGLRTTQLVELLKPEDPKINANILKKRISLMSDRIEFIGAAKNGGYYYIQ